MDYAVIEVNPRVSRSSALASKATGYPIAKVATKIAIGYTLDEIINAVTGNTYACFEPSVDYLVVKFPKWPFDKFVYAKRTLGTQMMATGEVMSIGTCFESAMMKAVRSVELGLDSFNLPKFADKTKEELLELLHNCDDERIFCVYVDTCAAEYKAQTPYFYSTYDEENEAEEFINEHNSEKKKILVFGSGPIRIGQGIEFDYCSVHCVWALKKLGYEAAIANNNPETVSTDFDTADRLYFDPLTPEDVDNVLESEKPWGVVVQFGGQTAIKLTNYLSKKGVRILGTSADSIDEAEDRERFDELLGRLGIPRPKGETVLTKEEAVTAANKLGFPVLLRPSYVLGGQNMIIAHNTAEVEEYMDIITTHMKDNLVLIDKYMMGKEVEVDAICDGEDYLIPGIMEHIERAGIHSGDSISVYPAQTLSQRLKRTIIDYTGRLARALKVVGLVNIQYVIYNDEVYVIEVNPRSSRTIPYISKVTGVPMVEIATRMMFGEKLRDQGYGIGLYPDAEYVAVKVPVFSFEKLHDVDTLLGPEMKSTGEVLGIARTFDEALYKGLLAAGYKMKHEGGVLVTVRDTDKQEVVPIVEKYEKLGFKIYATAGTALTLNQNMIAANTIRKIEEEEPNIMTLFDENKIDYIITTSKKGRKPQRHSVQMRRRAVERSIVTMTALDTANALANSLMTNRSVNDIELVDITTI